MEEGNKWMDLLRKLDLSKYYPGKLRREDVLKNENLDEKKIEKTKDLGMIFLHRLLSCNYEARDLEIITESKFQLTQERVENPLPTSSRLAKSKQLNSRPAEAQSDAIHPLDVVLSVFLCADPMLQQDIANLMWKCKLAIPFITATSYGGTPCAHIWPLRSICVKWKTIKEQKVVDEEDSLLSPSFLTIAFMRCQSSDVTKSITINTLLSDTEKVHPIFYHRNSRGSVRKRILVDGMVEISWYFPSTSGETLCSEPITVLNLRGNALMYVRQRELLMKMASICFIVCSSSELDTEEVDGVVDTIVNMGKKVFIITYDDKVNRGMATIELGDNVVIFNKESLTDEQLKETMRSQLKKMILKDSFQRTSVDTFVWKGVSVDLERQEIKNGLQNAEKIMTSLRSENIECRKDKLLPLHQGLWSSWVEIDKEMNRLKKLPKSQDIKVYKDRLAVEKVEKRKKQFEMLQNGLGISETISNFLKALGIKDKVTRGVGIRWLRIQMDKLSRMELRQILDKESTVHDRKELNKLQEMKDKCHLGLEHLFREVGQIYEAIYAQPPSERFDMGFDLPFLAARFLLDGNALEIYDGDAGAVPIEWVSAVFERLSDIVKNETESKTPKCTVVTVYGMQSSGKSALMNSIFRCQFNVGAGRCTRGAQIQILKMNGEEMNIDYILLVDTEGVRSPEVPEEIRRPRDNEITTFVIGLGQKTLINLMGENTTYLTDVLPIAVRAFLRMECVGLKPACAIVYQNVDPQNRRQMSRQNSRLQEDLDNLTHNACEMEKKERKRFQDVIKFDVDNDIHYIPALWEGELPMATVSQEYSKEILKLKNKFQKFFSDCESQELTSYSSHIRSLWTAMTKDDFVYFCQNTLEMEARERLDTFWCDCVWELRMEARKVGSNMHTDIMNCPDVDKLDEIGIACREKISPHIMTTYNSQEIKLKDFFQGTKQRYEQYMIQWEASITNHLTMMRQKLIEDLTLDILRLRRLKESQLWVESNVRKFKDRIRQEIVQYLNGEGAQCHVIEDDFPAEKIRHLFEEKWKGWSNTVKIIGDKHEPKTNIAREAVDILREKFRSHESLVFQKSESLSLGNIMEFQLQRSHLIGKYITQNTLISAKAIVQKTTENVRKRLNELTKEPSPYKKGSLEEIIQMVAVNQKELEALGVGTTKEYEIEISIAVVSMAVSAFSNSENSFLDSFDPSRLLEQEKETCYVLYETYYKKTSFTFSFAKRVSELLVTANKNRLNNVIDGEVANDMKRIVYSGVLNDKKSFIYTILCRMASDGVFKSIMDYIQNPTQSIDYWLGIYVDEYASKHVGNQPRLRSLVDQLVWGHMKDFTAYAKETEKQLDKRANNTEEMDKIKDVTVTLWVTEFTQRASNKFEVNKLRELSDIFKDDTLDFRYFCAELLKQIETNLPNLEDLTTKGNASYETMREKVVKRLRDQVVGCTAGCPFCGEICLSAQPDHAGLHETSLHRPRGCHGYCDPMTHILAKESCQKLVASTQSFRDRHIKGKFVPYKEYQTIYSNWKIPGSDNPTFSSFWEWFMCTYITDLEKKHNAVRPMMPNQWKTYSKEGEIEKLKKEIYK